MRSFERMVAPGGAGSNMKLIDRVSTAMAIMAAWMFFLTGLFITYEVIARYVFIAPTIWTEEVSRLLLIWGTYLAMAALLHRREHISISIFTGKVSYTVQVRADRVMLIFVAALSAVTVWWGWDIAWDSFVRGRSTGTMLNIPNWWGEAAVPLGFALLLVQSLADLMRSTSAGGHEE